MKISGSNYESAFFAEYLAPCVDAVEVDVFEEEISNLTWRSGVGCADTLLRSVERFRPDFLISVSSNYRALALALRALVHPHLRRSNAALDFIGLLTKVSQATREASARVLERSLIAPHTISLRGPRSTSSLPRSAEVMVRTDNSGGG